MKHINSIQDVVNAIVEARKAKKLSQSELGKRLGIPQSYISRLESGRLDIRLSSIIDISRFLGLEIVLAPVQMIPTINSMIGTSSKDSQQPLYTLDDFDDDDDDGSTEKAG